MTMKQMLLFMYKTASKRKLHLSWEEIGFMNLYLDVRLARITKKKLYYPLPNAFLLEVSSC